MRRLVGLALALAAVAGCSGKSLSSKDIELTIGVAAAFPDGEIATVKTLDVAVVGGKQALTTVTLMRPLGRTERMIVHFANAAGMVQVSALARDATGGVVLRGVSATVDLADSGGPHPASLTLYEPVTGAHSPAGFELAPATFSLFTGQTVALATKDEKVTWSSDDGGTIDSSGVFTAPSAAGTFHPVATSTIYPTDKASATINALATGITRYAGGPGGAGLVDGTGTAGRVNIASGMTLDGNALYFTEFTQTLRRVDLSTGELTTVAGEADRAQILDGTGAAANFFGPTAVATDGTTIWVADIAGPCIRAVTKSGVVTTLAGKPGTGGTTDGVGSAALFSNPWGLAYDASKHLLYVSDVTIIRSVDVTNGTVTTIAGTPNTFGSTDGPAATATFSNPRGLVLDGSLLFVYESDFGRLRRLDLGTKTVSTVSSNVYAGSFATAGSGKLAFTNPVRILDVATGAMTTIMGADKQAIYDYGNTIVMQDDGSFWLGAYLKLDHFDAMTGKLTTFAGYGGPLDQSLGTRASAGLNGFNSFVVRASDGVVFARDARLVRIDGDGTVSLVAMGTGGGQVVQGDGDMAFGSDGMLYAPDRQQNVIWRIDIDHGAATTVWAGSKSATGTTDGPVASARFFGPVGIVADGDMLYVTDQHNHTIRGLNVKTGVVTTIAGTGGMCGFVDMPGAAARFCNPEGIATDGAGNLYVADNNAIRKVVIAGGAVSQFVSNNGLGAVDGPSGTAKLWGPGRLMVDPQKKYVYFGEFGNDTVRRADLATGVVSTVAGTPGKASISEGPLPGAINQPGVLGFAKTGELLVAVPRENSLVQIRLP